VLAAGSAHPLATPIRFLLAGAAAALVNFGSRIVFNAVLPYEIAIILAYLCGMATAFLLTRQFVFRQSTEGLRHQMFWFVVVNLFALIQTLAVSLLLADIVFPRAAFTWHPETIAHAAGIAVPMFTSYIGHKRLTFR
jgi:putative flippase GtrA